MTGGQAHDVVRKRSACQACRQSKVRCHGERPPSSCSRCLDLNLQCVYLPSRRGRPVGSKNRRDVRDDILEIAGNGIVDQSGNGLHTTSLPHISPADSLHLDDAGPEDTYMTSSDMGTSPKRRLTDFRDEFPVERDRREDIGSGAGAGSPRAGRGGVEGIRSANEAILQVANEGARGEASPLETRSWARHHDSASFPDLWLPPEDDRRRRMWTEYKLMELIRQQRAFYRFGVHGSKRDISRSLDPINLRLVTAERVTQLFNAYWTHIHPFSCILEPSLYTPEYVRNRSALLFTTVLLIGSMVLSSREPPDEAAFREVSALQSHAEKLQVIVYSAGAKSVEIVQAILLWADNPMAPPTLFDDDRHVRLAAATRMAVEIGLHLPRATQNASVESHAADINDLRVRTWLLIFDTRYWLFHDGFMSDLQHLELNAAEIERLKMFSPYDADASLPAYHALFMFQRQMKDRLAKAEASPGGLLDLALDAEIAIVDGFLDQWTSHWCPSGIDLTRGWIFRHEALTAKLLLHLRILARRGKHSQTQIPIEPNPCHQAILRAAESIFEQALEHNPIPHLSWKTGCVVFAAGIILRLKGKKDLIMRVALRMAGDPDHPPLNTFTRQNGYQMLAMLSNEHSTSYPEHYSHIDGDERLFASASNTNHQDIPGIGSLPMSDSQALDWLLAPTDATYPPGENLNLNHLFQLPEEPFDFSYTPNLIEVAPPGMLDFYPDPPAAYQMAPHSQAVLGSSDDDTYHAGVNNTSIHYSRHPGLVSSSPHHAGLSQDQTGDFDPLSGIFNNLAELPGSM